MTEITVRPTEYTVSCFPEGHEDASSWDVKVEYRGPGSWAVTRFHRCYGRRGQEVFEPSPSSRTDSFKKAYRFDLDTAMAIAKRVAPKVVVNGMTPAQVLARTEGTRVEDFI